MFNPVTDEQEHTTDRSHQCVSSIRNGETLLPQAQNKRPLKRDNFGRRLYVQIVSAKYGPCEGLSDGDIDTRTRDVTPFMRALLLLKEAEEASTDESYSIDPIVVHSLVQRDESQLVASFCALSSSGMGRREISLLDHSSTNAVFGDPCPGLSKRLEVKYLMSEQHPSAFIHNQEVAGVHTISFTEHDRITITRQCSFHRQPQIQKKTKLAFPGNHHVQKELDLQGLSSTQALFQRSDFLIALSEVFLPMVLPYLSLRDRLQLKFVCKKWSKSVRLWGVASTIDASDPSFQPFTCPVFRGILSNSFSSLERLLLNDFGHLQTSDLADAIPNLKKLRYIDFSRCHCLDDGTMELLGHVSGSLEVLYIKGLRRVTDVGLTSVARSCNKLHTLDISGIQNVTDLAAMEVGQHLQDLRALYLRDNFKITSRGIDAVTRNCIGLEQLTVWGCIQIVHLQFYSLLNETCSCQKLKVLNLWGCHKLDDQVAVAFKGMGHLTTLIAADCHQLTDSFIEAACRYLPQLHHLNVRFCRLLSDASIHYITTSMPNLYSLEASHCPKLTVTSIARLLETRGESLAELRLQQCHQLWQSLFNSTMPQRSSRAIDDEDGRCEAHKQAFLYSLKSHDMRLSLSVLDLRYGPGDSRAIDKTFDHQLRLLGFAKYGSGYFHRPAAMSTELAGRHISYSKL